MLEEVYQKCIGAERCFKHKAILYVSSESYDAAMITIVQGLEELGFTIYTLKKPSINAWFCNEVIENPGKIEFDFALSDMHWGTRWDYYERFELHGYSKVLVDGVDNYGDRDWREKFERYRNRYEEKPKVASRRLQPFRWTIPLGEYEPDVVFTSQKVIGDGSCYLPFGIHREQMAIFEEKSTRDRRIDLANVPGAGARRRRLTAFLAREELPGKVWNAEVRGAPMVLAKIGGLVQHDKNVHGYHRWAMFQDYFKLLNNTKVLVYPGVTDYPHWDSKRPWEALASGCLVMLRRPNVDVSEYPVTELCEFVVWETLGEFVEKYEYLLSHQDFLDQCRREMHEGAMKYFTPTVLARRFLRRIHET